VPVAVLTKAQTGTPAMDAFAPSWSPDGSRIAFNCASTYGDMSNTPAAAYTGYGTNASFLCVVDASGRNFRVLTGINSLAKIFPPAWEGSWLIYGGTPTNQICPDTLCVYDLWDNNHYMLDPEIPAGADMPVRVNQYLFYRFTDVNGPTLRVIDSIDYTGCNPGPCDFVHAFQPHPAVCAGNPGNDVASPRPNFVHTDVVFDTDGPGGPGCTFAPVDARMVALTAPFDVDYYEVSSYGMNIMMYRQLTGLGLVNAYNRGEMEDASNGPCADGVTTDSNRCWPEWYPVMDTDGFKHFVDNMVGNWFWDNDPAHHTLHHAERDTVDWTP
jgi:hypothetical protein